jgi:hypothetical protein
MHAKDVTIGEVQPGRLLDEDAPAGRRAALR